MPSYDEVAKKIGTFGFYQKRALIFLYFGSIINGSAIMLCGIFVIYTPPHRCYIPAIDDIDNTSSPREMPKIDVKDSSTNSNHSSYPTEVDLSYYIPFEKDFDGTLKWSQCHRYADEFHDNTTSPYNRTVIGCDKGWRYFPEADEVSATMEFDLVCDRAWLAPLAPSVMMMGVMAGSIAGGYISDRYGRRLTLLVWWSFMIVCSAALALLPTWKLTFIFWFLGGAVAFVRSVVSVILVNEMTSPKHRHAAGVVNMHAVSIGYMLTPLICYFLKNWRYIMGAYAIVQTVGFFLIFFWVKESIKWLLEKGKQKEANAIVKEIAKLNNKTPETEEILFDMISENKNQEREMSKPIHNLSYWHLLKIRFLRKRLLIFGMSWFAIAMNYHGLSIYTNSLGGSRYISCFIAGGVEIPGELICLASLKRFGGRVTAILMTGLCGICLLLVPLFQTFSRHSVLAFSMASKMFITGSLCNVFIFQGDLFPTLLRNQSYGAGSFLGRFGGIIIPFILYLGETYHRSIPYLVMGSIAVAAASGMIFIPETKNMPIPDTLEDAKNQERFNKTRRCCHSKDKDNVTVGDENEDLSSDSIVNL